MRSILLFILVAVQNGHLVTSVSQEQLNMVDDYSNKHPETNSFSQKSLDSLYELSKVKYNGNYQRIPTVEEITGLSQKDLDSIRNLPDLSDVIKVEDPYQPPNHVNYGFNNKTFWRNYGIHFAIGAAVSTLFSIIVLVIRLHKQSKIKNDVQPLVNTRNEYP